jgi:prevent-host-death family protein
MITTTSADLIRHFRDYLDAVETRGEEIAIVRDNLEVARLVPSLSHQTALQAMGDLYGTLAEDAATGWLADSRGENGSLDEEARDPWDI